MSFAKVKKQGTNQGDVQEMNRSLVIRLMRQMAVCSRAELAKETGLKRATITNIINDLIDWGLVKEVGMIEGQAGRRSIGITLNSESYKTIGVRLTRKYFAIGVYDIIGNEYNVQTFEISESDSPRETLEKIKRTISDLLKHYEKDNFVGIGCAIPGPFLFEEGKVALITEFPGWENIILREELEAAFDMKVYLEHDANVGALAEWWLGGKIDRHSRLVYIAAGQGIGAGVVIDGQVFRGADGIAGEIGHTSICFDGPQCECGNRGCLTNYCSVFALMNEIKRELPNYPESMLKQNASYELVLSAIKQHDSLGEKVLTDIAGYLSVGLINVIYTYNPDVIIIGDDLAKIGDPLLRLCREKIERTVLPSIYNKMRLELSSFEKDPVLVGAAVLAVDRGLSKPSRLMEETIK